MIVGSFHVRRQHQACSIAHSRDPLLAASGLAAETTSLARRGERSQRQTRSHFFEIEIRDTAHAQPGAFVACWLAECRRPRMVCCSSMFLPQARVRGADPPPSPRDALELRGARGDEHHGTIASRGPKVVVRGHLGPVCSLCLSPGSWNTAPHGVRSFAEQTRLRRDST